MALVSMGIYVFKKKVLLESLRYFCGTGKGCDFGHDIIPSLIHTGRTYAYDFRDEMRGSPRYWRDIGTLDGYYAASMDLVQPDAPFDPYANDGWPSQPTRHTTFSTRAEAKFSQGGDTHCDVIRSVLSPCVHLEQGVSVSDSVLMPGVRIGKGARLRRTIVEEGVHLPADFQVGFDLEHDRRRHKVTEGGVVVVGRTPTVSKPVLSFALRGANTHAATTGHRDGVPATA